MRYLTTIPLKLKTQDGEVELKPGDTFKPKSRAAIKSLLAEGKIKPLAVKVWSEILQDYLWVVDTDKDMHSLRASQGASEAIYTSGEVKKLKGLSKDSLREIHKVKEIFKDSKVEE
jgi:hypothetical protein